MGTDGAASRFCWHHLIFYRPTDDTDLHGWGVRMWLLTDDNGWARMGLLRSGAGAPFFSESPTDGTDLHG